MSQRVIHRYSVCFKRQVVADLESGRFNTVAEAKAHYGIGGNSTVNKWVRRFGKNHLLPKVITVQKPNEPDQIRQLKRQIAQLEQALGQTQVESVLNRQFLKIACQEMGCDVESFKKKVATPPSIKRKKKAN